MVGSTRKRPFLEVDGIMKVSIVESIVESQYHLDELGLRFQYGDNMTDGATDIYFKSENLLEMIDQLKKCVRELEDKVRLYPQ